MSLVNVIDGFLVGGHHYHPTFNEELGCQRQLFGKKTRNDKWHSCSHKHLAIAFSGMTDFRSPRYLQRKVTNPKPDSFPV